MRSGEWQSGICEKCTALIQKGFSQKKRFKPLKKNSELSYQIPKMSVKRKAQNDEYLKLRKEFLKVNTICPVTGEKATEIHHKKGREGKLLTDVNYFLAVSRKGHQQIELNPIWAKEKGFSIDRTHE